MPPKRPSPRPQRVTKRKTRSETREEERIARQNAELAERLGQIAAVENEREEEENTRTPESTPKNLEENSTEIQVLIASLNDEISRLRAEKRKLEQDARDQRKPEIVTLTNPDGNSETIRHLLTNTLEQLSYRQQLEETTTASLPIELTPEETILLNKARLSYRPFDYSGKEANHYWEYFKDINAKVTEKYQVWWTENWTTASKWLATKLDKPALETKLWKQIAFGEFVDLSEFRDKTIRNTEIHKETKLKTENKTELKINLTYKPKYPIINLSQWLEAFQNYSNAVCILYFYRREELEVYQDRIV